MKKRTKKAFLKELWFLRSIIIVSIFTIILLLAYSFLFLTPSYVKLIEKITEEKAIQAAHHMTHMLLPERIVFTKDFFPKDFPDKVHRISQDLDIMKVKIFAPDGETIFSTSPEDIGVINTRDYFHDLVKSGKPFTKIVQKDTKSLENQTVAVDVVETYAPVMDGETFLGAFEVYLDITKTKSLLDRLVNTANILLVGIIAGLFFAMIWIVSKAKTNILARQDAEEKILLQSISLEEKNNDLTIINAVSDVINESFDLQILLNKVLKKLAENLGISSDIKGLISLMHGPDNLRMESHFGYDDTFIKGHEQLNMNKCRCGQAAKSGDILVITEHHTTEAPTYCTEAEDRSHIIVPLVSQNEIIGILCLHAPKTLDLVNKKELLGTIGKQLGLAVSNVKQFMENKKHSFIDPLTGIGNRRNMEAHISRFVSEAKRHTSPLTFAMADIDHFKNFNDTYGHAKGDETITRVASILKNQIRDLDFVARYGGEEFLILFSKTDTYEAKQVCERIRAQVENETDVTISLGLASYQPGGSKEETIKAADTALYSAKKLGRNRTEIAKQS